jgi:predicted small lipoprotein YifL
MNRRLLARLLALLVLGVALAGCGKKGPPQPPPGVPNTYPRVYPNA